MLVEEVVILPLSEKVRDIQEAATRYEQQFRTPVLIQIRGHVLDETYHQSCLIPSWQHVGELDQDLDIVGLGPMGAGWQNLAWVYPIGPGYIRLSPRKETDEL